VSRGRGFGATAGAERLSRLALIGVILVPLLIGGILGWALATPVAHLERVTAAIVDEDDPVTIDGQTVPLGRELAAGLIAGGEPTEDGEDVAAPVGPTFDWVLTNSTEAASGLASGRYVAVVTIPSSFSADATSISGPGAQARQAVVHVETTTASAWLDSALTAAVTDEAAAAMGRELTGRYLAQVYDGFNTIGTQIGQAADGAEQLAAGAASSAAGAAELASAATRLADGSAAVASGADDLAAGLARLDTSVQSLPARTAELARGADEVARTIGEGVRRIEEAALALADVSQEICAVDPGALCRRTQDAVARLESAVERLRPLESAARRVAVGNDALAVLMPDLVSSIDDSASGASRVADGATTARDGSEALAGGAEELADGTAQVDEGAAQLAAGLDDASQRIPVYSQDDITTLSAVVAQPVTAEQNPPGGGLQSVPLFTTLALWLGGLVTALALQAVPTRRLLTGASSAGLAVRAVAPVAAIGTAQGIVVGAAVLTSVGVDPPTWVAYVGASVLVGAAFGLANQGLAAAFGGAGRIISIAIALFAVAAGLTSTVPPVISGIAAVLPTAAADALLGATLGPEPWAAALFGVTVTAVAGFGLVFAGVAARRRVPAE
jgi:putative membrane protein